MTISDFKFLLCITDLGWTKGLLLWAAWKKVHLEGDMPWCDYCKCWHHETATCIYREPASIYYR